MKIFVRNHSDGNRYYDHVTVEKKTPAGLTGSGSEGSPCSTPTHPYAGADSTIPNPDDKSITKSLPAGWANQEHCMDKLDMLKSHIDQYVRKDGVVVGAHEDKRLKKFEALAAASTKAWKSSKEANEATATAVENPSRENHLNAREAHNRTIRNHEAGHADMLGSGHKQEAVRHLKAISNHREMSSHHSTAASRMYEGDKSATATGTLSGTSPDPALSSRAPVSPSEPTIPNPGEESTHKSLPAGGAFNQEQHMEKIDLLKSHIDDYIQVGTCSGCWLSSSQVAAKSAK